MVAKLALGLAVAALTATAASAAVTLRDRQQAACYNDVQKLCGQYVPDTQKIEACMLKNKSKVSAGCRKYFTD